MAIRMMIDKAAYEAGAPGVEVVTGFHGHPEPLYMQTTYKGFVVDTFERNGYDDSDFYAVVWDVNTKAPKEVMYGTTRGWSYPNGAAVDATPEVAEAYTQYKENLARQARIVARTARMAAPERGKVMKVVRGRKVPLNTIGRCFWVGVDRFGKTRVGLDTGVDRVFTAASNIEVQVPMVG